MTNIPFDSRHIQLICEVDEQWSFVGKKSNQRWLWYAWEPRFKRVVAYVFGRRTSATLLKLLVLLKPFKIRFFCTDNFSPYESYLPESKHITGKSYTQRIERQNLTLRTRLKRLMRKTICFSKSEDIHDKVIGTFIERYYFNALAS